ncbi:UDP-glucosyltransferase 2-like [Hylaeus anthracinus]|uniref:UDP-glucosyltransferase 2-like n=1 Tax=Hylaeus anthracinus TaxID=313031 RepID=UPI0023B8A464|nr:UDP-glucosyltransferase 2-like [Hylaeus anthracinus]
MRLHLSILLTILGCCHVANGLRILAIFPLNGRSHWITGQALTMGLARRGHQVDVVSHFPQKKPVPNYRDISLEGTLEPVINSMNASMVKDIGAQDFELLVQKVGTKICDLLEHEKIQQLIHNPPKDPPYDLVIVELFMFPCFLGFGRHLNVPMVGVMASTFHEWVSDVTGNMFNPSFMPCLFSPYRPEMTFYERLMNTLLTNLVGMQLKYHIRIEDEYVKKHFNIDESVMELHKDLAVILVNSHHSLNGVKPMTNGVIEIGGLHITEQGDPLSPEIQKWLDESTHGCVYFTLGSMVRIETYPESVQRAFLNAFESIAPVRVLMKVAHKEDLIPKVPKNVMIQSWFPQVSVFKHKNIKAFITHGGTMSIQEAVYFGIPMVGIPLFGDQPTNMNNVAHLNIAVSLGSLKNVTEETLSYSLNKVLKDKTYQENMKRISKLFKDRPMSAMDTAIYWVEYAARNGNALRSPAIRLRWWQQQLFDVYGFILACLALALYVVIFVLRKLTCLLFGSKACSKKPSHSSESKKRK